MNPDKHDNYWQQHGKQHGRIRHLRRYTHDKISTTETVDTRRLQESWRENRTGKQQSRNGRAEITGIIRDCR